MAASEGGSAWQQVRSLPGVELVPKHNGTASVRVRGLEFAQIRGGEMVFGEGSQLPCTEIHRIVEELSRARSPEGADRDHPLFRRFPEAWLESQVRQQIAIVDASLAPDPVYGQVPAFAGGERGILDLLAADRSGRLAVLELKASADLHLPMQALDYWIRVKWHLDRGEFSEHGYFPGIQLLTDPPRLLLVSPCLEFHPSTEALLSYYSPTIEVERVGLGVEWRKELQVMFRLAGAERPQ